MLHMPKVKKFKSIKMSAIYKKQEQPGFLSWPLLYSEYTYFFIVTRMVMLFLPQVTFTAAFFAFFAGFILQVILP